MLRTVLASARRARIANCVRCTAVQRTVVEHGGSGCRRRHNAAGARRPPPPTAAPTRPQRRRTRHCNTLCSTRRGRQSAASPISRSTRPTTPPCWNGYLAELRRSPPPPASRKPCGSRLRRESAPTRRRTTPSRPSLCSSPSCRCFVGHGAGAAAAAAEAETAAVVEDAGRAAVSATTSSQCDGMRGGGGGGCPPTTAAPAGRRTSHRRSSSQGPAELSAAEATHAPVRAASSAPSSHRRSAKDERPEKMRRWWLANLAENPATHDDAFGGDDGARARIVRDCSRRRAPNSNARASGRSARDQQGRDGGRGLAVDDTLLQLLLQKARMASGGGEAHDDEVAFPRARARPVVAAAQPPQDRRRRSAHVLVGAPRRHGRAGRGGDGDLQRDPPRSEVPHRLSRRRPPPIAVPLRVGCSSCRPPPPVRSPTSRRRSTTSRRFARRARRSSCTRTTDGGAPATRARHPRPPPPAGRGAARRRRRGGRRLQDRTPPTSERSAKSRARSHRRRRRTTTS